MNIAETVNVPSKALQAMVVGLQNPGPINVMMTAFYVRDKGKCFGCAATCALQQIAKKKMDTSCPLDSPGRAKFLGFNEDEMMRFECAMDDAREGSLRSLFAFFNRGGDWKDEYDGKFYLSTESWQENIPEVQKLIRKLKRRAL